MEGLESKLATTSPESRLAFNRATPDNAFKLMPSNDVDMIDAAPTDEKDFAVQDDAGKQQASQDLPAPPENPQWASSDPAFASEHSKPNDMHLQMPPPPSNPFGQADQSAPVGTPTNHLVQSPATLGHPSIFSPFKMDIVGLRMHWRPRLPPEVPLA